MVVRSHRSPICLVGAYVVFGIGMCDGRIAIAGSLDSLARSAIQTSLRCLERGVLAVRDSNLYPAYGTPDLRWQLKPSSDWVSGFYPGCLWYAYELSGDPRFKQWAEQWTAGIEKEKLNAETHDLGFRFMCSFGNGLRLCTDSVSCSYRGIILTAARTLSGRYNPKIGCLSSNWDRERIPDSFPVVIDIMMNLEILFWASQHGGPVDWASIARTHALSTCRDFVRPDGGTYHIVRYNKITGAIINKGQLQGERDESTWTRGHAWMVYGLVVTYRYTKEKPFLDMAVRLANYFLKNLPEDGIAPWDFQSQNRTKDVSASCIVASALLELVNYFENDSVRTRFRKHAEMILASLCSAPNFVGGGTSNCLLTHSTQYLPINSNVDVPAIFADYYFLEALTRFCTSK